MSRDLGGGMVTDDLPTDTSQPVLKTQFPNLPPDPAAIHNRYPPVGCSCGSLTGIHEIGCPCWMAVP
jgi:hypothetical protein